MTLAMNGPSTMTGAIDNRRIFNPYAPIGSAGALKGLLETQRDGIKQALPKHITPERLIKTLLVAVNRNPQILECTQASILETINRAAELGLDLSGTLGEAYPVPFNNKIKLPDGKEIWAMQCSLIIGYRGLEKLAWQSGEVDAIDAEVVYLNDKFVFKKGTEVLVEWSPCLTGDRGAVIGAYACVRMKSGGKLARFLPKSEIEKIRNASKSKSSPAWANWWDEMARKCALKRTLKDAPLSTEKFVSAIEQDADDGMDLDVLHAATNDAQQRQGGSVGLLAKIRNEEPPAKSPKATGYIDDPAFPAASVEPPAVPATRAPAAAVNEQAYTASPPLTAEQRQVADPTRVPDHTQDDQEQRPATDPKEEWNAFVEELNSLASQSELPEAKLQKELKATALKLGIVGKEWKMKQEDRDIVRDCVKERRGNFA